ncbi:Cutinase 3 [Penicillium brasilianum]|uniref:Cutinase n=1 Tax=Penicillium brasilianum TaxID=104259 RepID=A0A1S9RR42_PENBI|nr:Cutinase 3 [Penicillium brasilianum]
MFLQALLPLLLTPLVAASPIQLDSRQYISANDLTSGNCKDFMFIFARGSTETGNMGTIVGPEVCTDLGVQLGGKVGCQGIGGAYTAGLEENFLPQNTAPQDIQAAVDVFNECNTKCPNAKIVAGGYSQGSAVIDNAIQKLSSEVRDKVKAVVLFGFTRNLQDSGRIPGYPKDQTKVYCATGDMVCDGTLIITAAHLTYGANAADAASFLASHVK